MKPRWRLLLDSLREPASMARRSADDWDLLLRQATGAGLLGRLGALAQTVGVFDGLPEPVRHQMEAMLTVARQQQRAVRLELALLAQALAGLPGPVLVLKGAAYVAAGLAPAEGRLFSDIDLLVPKAQLMAAESALALDGWQPQQRSAYDQRYYRQWMHELPPLMHIRRRTVLDLHHSILPETARLKTRPDRLVAAARPLPDQPGLHLPEPADLVLHSATHLMHEGQWQHGLRDLVDIDALLRQFGADPAFWGRLGERAAALNLGRPLHHALRQAVRWLRTPLPAPLLATLPDPPGRGQRWLMDELLTAGLATAHRTCGTRLSPLAAQALYVRSHWLRMPLHLLLPHLARKAWMGLTAEPTRDGTGPNRPVAPGAMDRPGARAP